MGFIPRRRIKENLKDVQVFIDDTQNEYIKVQDIPDTFVQGRSAFKVFGSTLLKDNVPLKIEILDKVGNTIWTQPVKYGQDISPKLPYRYVSVEVYPPPFNVPGEAELIILGELEETEVPFTIPQEFIGTYNVRYRKTINIDTEQIVNEQPILFYKKPKVTATELVKSQKKTAAPDNAYISGSQIYGIVNLGVQGTTYNTGSNTNTQTDTTDKSQTSTGDLKTQANLWKYKTGLYKKNKMLERRGIKQEKGSPEPPQMTIYDTSNESKFISKLIGGNITITDIKIPSASAFTLSGLSIGYGATTVAPEAAYNAFTFPDFVGKIENVISDTELTVTQPYSVEYTEPFNTDATVQRIYSNIGDDSGGAANPIYANFTASYVDWDVPTTSSYRFDSFVDFKVEDMRTFSGDIYRIKVSGGSDSSLGDFSVLLDTVVDAPELLVDTVSPSGVLRSGYFIDQTHIDKYWNTYGGDNTTNTLSPYYTMSLADGIYLSGSYSTYNQVGRVDLNSTYSFTVKKDVVYTLSFKAKGRKLPKNTNSGNTYAGAKLFFHLSGSNLTTADDLGIQYSASFGHTITNEHNQKVGLQITNQEVGYKPDGQWKDFGFISHTFTPKFKLDRVKNTDTILQLRIHSGEWIFSDVSLQPATSTGFSPDEFAFRVPIQPNTLRPDNYDFLVEYLDINGNTAETVTFLDNIAISGSALILEGTDNLLTGSLFMGNVQDSGIEAAGANSAFVRSVGYIGFTSASVGAAGAGLSAGDNTGYGGFMIWSGSVLPNSPDSYAGAGIEIHDGTSGENESYLKFRTVDAGNDYSSSFIVKTSKFFLGSSDQFVSGSDGNVEISSSDFHLTPQGNVTMSGAITAKGGTLGGFTIGDTTLTTTGVTIGNATEDLFISSSAFKIDHTGNVTASNMDLGGKISATSGDIGGWTIESGQLVAGTGNNAVSMSGDLGIIAMGTGSSFNKSDLQGGLRMGLDTDGNFKFAIGTAASYLHFTEADGVSIKSDSFDVTASVAEINVELFGLKSNNLEISSSGQYIAAGDPVPTGIDGTNKGFYLKGDPGSVLIGNAAGAHFSFDGTNADLSSSAFYLGNNTNYISGSLGNIKIQSSGTTILSGSSVQIKTPDFFMGQSSQFVSGSDGNIEISSSKFHLKPDGDIVVKKVTAVDGTIGGWTVTSSQIQSSDGNMRINTSPKKITIGNHTFGNAGVQIGYDSGGTIGFYVGNGGNRSFIWDGSNFHISSSNLTVDGANSIVKVGNASNEHILVNTDGLTIKDGSTVRGKFVAGGAIIGETSKPHISASTLDVNVKYDSNNYSRLDSDSLDIVFNGGTSASFGTTTTIGPTTGNHVIINESGVQLKEGSTVRGKFLSSGATLGATTSPHVSASTAAIYVKQSDDDYVVIDSDSVDVYAGGTKVSEFGSIAYVGDQSNEHIKLSTSGLEVKDGSSVRATFAATTYVGDTSNEHVKISTDGVELKDSSTVYGKFAATSTFGLTGTTAPYIEIAAGTITIKNNSSTFLTADSTGLSTTGTVTATDGTIGGWSIDASKIYSTNLNMLSSGVIETSDFESGIRGWRLDSINNGRAEFENITIRGTLKTTVFEKETVNAVGGQLYVANSSMLTGSQAISASAATMSVVNVSGFTGSYDNNFGEILAIKKITDTGFSTEYVLVQSASRNDPSSDSDFSGDLYVVRGYSGSLPTSQDSGSLGNAASIATTYNPGQVLASTGRSGSGYIRLNANPNDSYTPFIDIVERTGSAIYDIELKARLGDLSGISSAKLHGSENPGFGLYSENVFLTGGISANTGSIAGWDMTTTQLKKGTNIVLDSSNKKISVNSSTWTAQGIQLDYNSGTPRAYIGNGGNRSFIFDGSNIHISGSNLTVDGANSIVKVGDSSNEHVEITTSGVKVKDGSTVYGEFAATTKLGDIAAGDWLELDSTGIDIYRNSVPKFTVTDTTLKVLYDSNNYAQLDSDSLDIVLAGETSASFGTITSIGPTSGRHVRIDADDVRVKFDSNNYSKMDSNSFDIVLGGQTSASFGTTTSIGPTGGNHVLINSDGLTIKNSSTVRGKFVAAGAIIGETGNAHISASTLDVTVIKNSSNYTQISSSGMTVVAGGIKKAQFATTTIIGDASNEHMAIGSSGLSIIDGATIRGKFTAAGAIIGETSKAHISASTYDVNVKEDVNNYAQVSSSGMSVYHTDGAGGKIRVGQFASTTTIGDSSAEHIQLDSDGLTIKDATTVRGKFIAAGAIIGETSKAHISASTYDVNVKEDDNNYAQVSSSGMSVYSGGTRVGEFGANTVLTGGTLTLQSTAGTVGDDRLVIGSANLTMYANDAAVLDIVDGKINIGPSAAGGTAVTGNVRVEGDNVYIYGDHTSTYTQMSSAGLRVYKNGAGDSGLVATYGENAIITGGTVTIQGTTGAVGHDKLVLGSASIAMYANQAKVLDIVDGKINIGPAAVGGTAVTGNVRVEGDAVYLYGDHTSTYTKMTSAGLQVYKNGAGDSGLVATYAADTLITGGTITLQGTTGTLGDDRIVLGSASIAMYTADAKVFDMVDGKLNIGPAAVGGTAVTGNIRVEADAVYLYGDHTSTYSKMTTAGLQVYKNGAGDSGLVATYGTNATITGGTITLQGTTGTVGDDKLVIGSGDISIYTGGSTNSDRKVHINDDGINIGPRAYAGNAVIGNIRLQSDGAFIYGAATDDFLQVKSDGVVVVAAAVTQSVFGATTTIGNTSSEHVKITASKLELKRGSETFVSASSAGLYTSGSINANTGIIGGWAVLSGSIESNRSDFRGIKIKVGKGIDGYSTTAHSKSTDQGKFNFGIAPAPGGTPGCFLAGTLIQMLNGIKRIEDVVVGDTVKSFDLKTNSIKDSKVLWLSVHDDFDYMIINGIIKVTSNHPFYSDGNWIEAGDLSVGDKILHIDGLEHTIKTIELSNELTTVYNFEVEGYHNYFAEGYLVHNAEKDSGGGFIADP